MNIVVCIKQVPASSNVKVDPVTGVLIRDGIESKMNPYDLFALEEALSLRAKVGGSVKVITMGPNAAKAVLTEAIYMGADEGILISDRRFGGADVLATSYTLSSAIRSLETEDRKVDLVLCGKQTTDGDTAQVGAEMAEYLDLPQYSNVRSLKLKDGTNDALEIVSLLGTDILTADIQLPCVLCTDAEINTPRLPSYLRKCAVDPKLDELITVLTLDDFIDHDPTHYGLKGSATSVERIFPPDKNEEHSFLTGDPRESTRTLVESLKTRKLL
ncbi:MAG: electron transfer flavoprotein subunit beta/FixA family protein [Firmicutes bacterium]|nr:electron transfer flavoprotein subunit beta/FixA family protein [Bacillota bacterium]